MYLTGHRPTIDLFVKIVKTKMAAIASFSVAHENKTANRLTDPNNL